MVSTGFTIWQRGFQEESERTGTWFVWSLRGYPPRWIQGVVTDIFSLQWQGAPWLDQPNWDSDTTCWLQLPGHPWRPEQAHWPPLALAKLPALTKSWWCQRYQAHWPWLTIGGKKADDVQPLVGKNLQIWCVALSGYYIDSVQALFRTKRGGSLNLFKGWVHGCQWSLPLLCL